MTKDGSNPPDRKRGRPSEAERRAIDEKVLDAAFAAFRQYGLAATRMDKIAADAGITKMSLYRRYAGKGDLLAAVIRTQAALHLAVGDEPDVADDPIVALKALLWTYRHRIGQDHMVAVQRLALAYLDEETEVSAAVADVRAAYVAPVDRWVEAAKAGGQMSSLPTEEIREILFDLLVNDAAALPLHGYASRADQRQIFDNRWAVLERGLLGSGVSRPN